MYYHGFYHRVYDVGVNGSKYLTHLCSIACMTIRTIKFTAHGRNDPRKTLQRKHHLARVEAHVTTRSGIRVYVFYAMNQYYDDVVNRHTMSRQLHEELSVVSIQSCNPALQQLT